MSTPYITPSHDTVDLLVTALSMLRDLRAGYQWKELCEDYGEFKQRCRQQLDTLSVQYDETSLFDMD